MTRKLISAALTSWIALAGMTTASVAMAQTTPSASPSSKPPINGSFNGGTMTNGAVPAGAGTKMVQPTGGVSGTDTPDTTVDKGTGPTPAPGTTAPQQ